MENAATATATETTPTAAVPAKKEKFLKVLGKTCSVLKGAMGASVLALAGGFVTSGLVLPTVIGAAMLYTGGRFVFEAGKELLPLKAQSAISKLFTGKELTEITPVRQPKTVLGKVLRVAELAAVTFLGFAGMASGALSLAWSGESAVATAYLYGGLATLATGAVSLIDQAALGITSLVKNRGKDKAAAPEVSVSSPAPDLAPASTLSTRSSGIAFNASAEVAAAIPVAAPQPKPPVATPPQP